MEEVVLKYLADFVFAGIILLLYLRQMKVRDTTEEWHRGWIDRQQSQLEKSLSWYQMTISNFMKGVAAA